MATDTQTQIAELEAKIQQLRTTQSAELKERLQEARRTVSELEAEIARITGKAPVAGRPERKRTSSEDVRSSILKVLASTPTGVSQKDISDATGLNYNTVLQFLKKNSKDFKTTGQLRAKRYFLK